MDVLNGRRSESVASGAGSRIDPATSPIPSSFARAAKRAAHSPSTSWTTGSPGGPSNRMFSGRATTRAPRAAASRTSASARSQFGSASLPLCIWAAATVILVSLMAAHVTACAGTGKGGPAC